MQKKTEILLKHPQYIGAGQTWCRTICSLQPFDSHTCPASHLQWRVNVCAKWPQKRGGSETRQSPRFWEAVYSPWTAKTCVADPRPKWLGSWKEIPRTACRWNDATDHPPHTPEDPPVQQSSQKLHISVPAWLAETHTDSGNGPLFPLLPLR